MRRLIVLASLIPGLGIWILGQPVLGGAFFALVVGLALIGWLAPWPWLQDTASFLALFVWIAQAVWTAVAVRSSSPGETRPARHAPPETRLPTEPSAPPAPADPSREEAPALQASRKIARSQLRPSERLVKSLIGQTELNSPPSTSLGPGAGYDAPFYCVALTTRMLVLIELNNDGKPSGVTRLPVRVVTSRLETGDGHDRLTLELGPGRHLVLLVKNIFRDQARALDAVLAKE